MNNLGIHREKWLKATEETRLYNSQLEELTQTKTFKDIVSQKAPKILDPKTQLFYTRKDGRSSRVSRRTVKK